MKRQTEMRSSLGGLKPGDRVIVRHVSQSYLVRLTLSDGTKLVWEGK